MDQGFRRRDFFKVLATGGAITATVAACVDPPEKLIPYLLPPDNVEFVPGRPLEYATTCMECPAHCGMVVKTREARAIKAEGNPDHPLSQGALCMRGQSVLQTHYNPGRISSALQREGSEFKKIAWDAAEAAFAEKLKAVSDKRRIVYLTGNAAGSRGGFIDLWLSALGGRPKMVLESLAHQNIKAANERTFRRAEVPQYLIEEANLLVNFGSEFLETWMNPVENSRQFASMHAYDDATRKKGKLVHVGPHLTLTGANADQWVSVKPGSETLLALAMAREVFTRNRGQVNASERGILKKFLAAHTLENAARDTGVEAGTIRELAAEFAKAAPSLALAGGNSVATREGTRTQIAVNLLNYVAGNIGKTLRFGALRQIDPSTPFKEVLATVKRMEGGEVALLIVDGANPLYQLPASSRIAAALERCPPSSASRPIGTKRPAWPIWCCRAKAPWNSGGTPSRNRACIPSCSR